MHFFERLSGLGNNSITDEEQKLKTVVYDMIPSILSMIAEPSSEYGKKNN